MIKQPETTVFGGESRAFRLRCLCIDIEVSYFGGSLLASIQGIPQFLGVCRAVTKKICN